jgi:hypothetical protein
MGIPTRFSISVFSEPDSLPEIPEHPTVDALNNPTRYLHVCTFVQLCKCANKLRHGASKVHHNAVLRLKAGLRTVGIRFVPRLQFRLWPLLRPDSPAGQGRGGAGGRVNLGAGSGGRRRGRGRCGAGGCRGPGVLRGCRRAGRSRGRRAGSGRGGGAGRGRR